MRLFLLNLFILLSATIVPSQTLPDSTIKKIDLLFSKWNSVNSPGCTIGIVRNDSLIYSKGYGMANLEYNIPNMPSTIYHMASVSKQFTAYAIVLLARQGKLNLDDNVSKYLTWFPDYKEKITIRNLLNHTSGIRDQWQLLGISGTRIDDVITQDHVIKILSKQQALNFKPGEEYSYSNSGFTMLAEIVKKVSGKSFRAFTDSAIFKPLGMNDSHFHDDYTEVVKNRSYSYDRIDSAHFANSVLSFSAFGSTGLFTNINDMSKWIMNFYRTKVGDEEDIKQLTQKLKLNDGTEMDYALGIINSKYKGWKVYSHEGSDAGYTTFVSVFPDLKMGFIVFSNLGDISAGVQGSKLEDLFVKDTTRKTVSPKPENSDSTKALLKEPTSLKKYMGTYIADEGIHFQFNINNEKAYWYSYGRSRLLKYEKDTLSVFISPETKFVFSVNAKKDTIITEYWPNNRRVLYKYNADTNKTDIQLQPYTGNYYCPELDCKYGIVLKDHHLILTNNKYDDSKIQLIGEDHLFSDLWWMDHMKMIRNDKKEIQGFEVNSRRIRHLKFNKIK